MLYGSMPLIIFIYLFISEVIWQKLSGLLALGGGVVPIGVLPARGLLSITSFPLMKWIFCEAMSISSEEFQMCPWLKSIGDS